MRFRFLAAAVALFFAALYTTEGFLFRDYNLDEFQVATGYLKDLTPPLYPTDFIWSKAEMTRNLHVCVRALMRFTEGITFGRVAEPIDLFLLWLPVCQILFFAGILLLAFQFTRDRWASLLTACSFMVVRRTIWDWWGIGPTYTMSARGLVLSVLPLGLWAYFRCKDDLRKLGGFFLFWGVISNLHPLSGWGLVELLGVTILVAERFRPSAWVRVLVMGAATLIGSAPFIWIWTHLSIMPAELRADPAILKPFWDDFGGLAFPKIGYVVSFLEDLAIPLGLSAAGFLVWRRMGKPGDTLSLRILWIFPAVVVFMTLLVLYAGGALKRAGMALPVMVPEHARSIKFVYLTLPVWIAFAFTGWLRARAASRPLVRFGPLVLVVLAALSINPPGHKVVRHILWRAGGWPQGVSQKLAADLRNDAADLEVALWARDHTAPDALFYFDSYEFRYYAQRSLVFCLFDRPCVAYRPTKDLEEWIRRRDRVKPLKLAGDTEGMLAAARAYQADYLVVLNKWKPPPEFPVWSNDKYSVFRVR